MPPSALQFSQLEYAGRTFFPSTVGSPDMKGCSGLGSRTIGGELYIYSWSFITKTIWEFKVPSIYNGNLTNPRNIGGLPMTSPSWVGNGIFWDELGQRMYFNSGRGYTSVATIGTLSVGEFNASNVLTTVAANQSFGTIYKRTQGSILDIPDWFASTYTSGKRLGAGAGGYYNVIGTGGSSMGPSLNAFDPTPATNNFLISSQALQGYNYATTGPMPTVQQRPTNYRLDTSTGAFPGNFDSRFPADPTVGGIGYVNWADELFGNQAWVDDGVVSGLLHLYVLGVDCCWYGHNDSTPPSCSTGAGTKAAINSIKKGYYWYITSTTDLALVAGGANPNSIQSTWQAVTLAGITNPTTPGRPSDQYTAQGMTWSRDKKKVGFIVRGIGASFLSAIYWFSLNSGTIPPPPDPIPAPIIVYPLNNATGIPI